MTRCFGCRMVIALLLLCLPSVAPCAQNAPPGTPLTLGEAVSLALGSSDLIRQAKEALASQEDAEKSARADLFPSVSATYRYTHLREAPYILFGAQPFETNGVNQYHWDVALRQPLFTGFALVTRHEMEKLGVDVKGEERRQATLSVVKNVKTGYFNVLLAEQLRKAANEALGQLAAHARDAARFYQQGLIPYNDVLKSRVALSDARQRATSAKSRLEMAISAFNLLIGRPMEQRTQVVDPMRLPGTPAALAPLLTEALSNRPAVQALRLAEKKARLAIRLAKAAYYPDITLTAGYEQNGQNAAASTNDYSNWHNAGVAIEARWNLISWGKRRANVLRRAHDRDAITARLHLLEDAVRLEVKQAYLDLAVANENIHTAQAALSQARESYRITDLRYRENIASSLDVIDARTDLTRAESNFYGARYGYQMAAADLDRAVGRMPRTEPDTRCLPKTSQPAAASGPRP
jgi:outer membrane protein